MRTSARLTAALSGRSRIQREPDRGGMATVYLAALLGAERFVKGWRCWDAQPTLWPRRRLPRRGAA